MLEINLLEQFIRPLNISGVPYMVSGSVATTIYGEPRLTNDVDIVVNLPVTKIAELLSCFNAEDFYLPPAEAIETEVERSSKGHFNIIHHRSGFKADFYPLGEDKLNIFGFKFRRRVELGEFELYLAPPEVVILRKLMFFKEGGSQKHIRDIRAVLDHQGPAIDRAIIEEWVQELGIASAWEQVRVT